MKNSSICLKFPGLAQDMGSMHRELLRNTGGCSFPGFYQIHYIIMPIPGRPREGCPAALVGSFGVDVATPEQQPHQPRAPILSGPRERCSAADVRPVGVDIVPC